MALTREIARSANLSEKLDRLAVALLRFPVLVGALCAGSTVLVGVVDYFTGIATSMSVFYLVPVTVAAFLFGRAAGLGMSVLVAAVSLVADWSRFEGLGLSPSIAMWNSLSRLLIAAILAVLVAALRAQGRHEKLAARMDVTTGVANARALFERLEESLGSARRNEFPLSVCLFDVDDFKRVNDAEGHAAGDRILRVVAQAAAGALRPGDTVARLGGDEFVLVLPGAEAKDARAAVERLVRSLESAAAKGAAAITLSVGVVTTSSPTTVSPDEVVKRADELMYRAKRGGKNRIEAEPLDRGGDPHVLVG